MGSRGWLVLAVAVAVLLAGGVAYRRARSRQQTDPFLPYVGALLHTLAGTAHQPIVLRTDRPLPRLTDLTQDPKQLAELARVPVRYEDLTVESVIGYLVGLAHYPTPDDPQINTLLHTKYQIPGGSRIDLGFQLKVTRHGSLRQMEITPEGPPVEGWSSFRLYLDGLLTTLARAPGNPLVLRTDRPLPKLSELTKDPDILAHAARLPAIDDRFDTDALMGNLVGLAQYPRPEDPEIDTLLQVKVADRDGQLRDVSFRLKVTKRERPWQMVITVE